VVAVEVADIHVEGVGIVVALVTAVAIAHTTKRNFLSRDIWFIEKNEISFGAGNL
jgi:hypothetical protein